MTVNNSESFSLTASSTASWAEKTLRLTNCVLIETGSDFDFLIWTQDDGDIEGTREE
jgi:hypothetical protein